MVKNREGFTVPHFFGPKDKVTYIVEHYNTIKPLIQTAGLQIKVFGCNARQAWHMVLSGDIHLSLGRGESQMRLQRFLTMYQYFRRFPNQCPLTNQCQLTATHFDLRYTNGIAIQRRLTE